ncbi:MAG TPA: porin [Planctomycetaceae bacterium]|nr:porin [Planctomycetaceae bacterium]
MHQGWIYAEKLADGRCGWDWGFRFDGMYGVDATDTQSFGNPPGSCDLNSSLTRGAGYGFALPQAYGELANGNWNIKLGHFFTLIGYEVVAAPDNFFYSHALTMYNTEPFTHTGALVSYSPTDTTTAYFGWTLGWDTGFDNNRGGNSYIGGCSHALTSNLTLTYIATMGNFGTRSKGGNGYSHSIVFDYQIDDRWNYVLQSDVLRIWPAGTQDDNVGINNYLLYTVSDKVRVGMRAEWWRNDVASQYAITGGVNYRPPENITVRPEIRYNWHLPNSRITFGMDVIWTF